MNSTVAELIPEVFESIVSGLRQKGYFTQAASLASSKVERWTYDPSVGAGYVYLVQGKTIQNLEAPVAESLAFMLEHGFNVDLNFHGEVFGIELLEHKAVFTRLTTPTNIGPQ